MTNKKLWQSIQSDAMQLSSREPSLKKFFQERILKHSSLEQALGFTLAEELGSNTVSNESLYELILSAYSGNSSLVMAAIEDLNAVLERDSACNQLLQPFLFFKGYKALQAHRVANSFWSSDRQALALYIQSRVSKVLSIDIHPAAQFGRGVMLDHATGLVVGETAVVGNQVSILQSVTLGGTGKEHGDRHPKIADGVLISAGAKILGNIQVGEGAKIGAGSVVLSDVPAHMTAAGVPARIVGKSESKVPALEMNHNIPN